MSDSPHRDKWNHPASLLASIVESSGDAIISKDLEGRILTWNSGAERIYGYPASQAVAQTMAVLRTPDCADQEDEILSQIRRGRRFDHFETVRQRKDGRRIHVSVTISPVLDEAGTIIGTSEIAREITNGKLAQEDLRAAKEQLQLLADNMPAAVTRCSRDFRYVWVSQRYAEWQQMRAEDIMGKPIREIVGQRGYEEIRPYMERVLSGKEWNTALRFTF